MAILTPSAENDFWDIKIRKITSKMGFLWLKLIYATFLFSKFLNCSAGTCLKVFLCPLKAKKDFYSLKIKKFSLKTIFFGSILQYKRDNFYPFYPFSN